MSKKIDLGSFEWNTDKVDARIADNIRNLKELKAELDTSKKSVKEMEATVKDLDNRLESNSKTHERLRKQLKENRISTEQYDKEVSKLVADTNNLVEARANWTDDLEKEEIRVNAVTNEIKELNRAQLELNKLKRAGVEEVSSLQGSYERLNRQLIAQKQIAKDLGAALVELKNDGKDNTEEYAKLEKEWQQASKSAFDLNTQLKELDASVGDNQRSVGDYSNAIKSAFSDITQGYQSLLSGDILGGIEALTTGFKNMKTAVAETYAFLLANPLTALLVAVGAVVVGIGAGINEIVKYNKAIKEQMLLVQQLTQTYGFMADEIRIRAKSLADSFDQDFSETLRTAATLSTQLGMSFDNVFNTIQQGFIRGANASGDFLDRLKEYGPLLRQNGFTLQEIVSLQIESQRQGIYSDKLEDSLKEAGLSLQEFTKAQSDALTSAFGKEFSDKVSKSVNDGVLSVKDALILMANEAKAKGLTVQELGILTADVFKGAGEDAGGAAKLFDLLYKGMDNLNEPLTKLQDKTLKLAQANEELARAKDRALKSDTMQEFMATFDTMLIDIQTGWYKFVEIMLDVAKAIDDALGITESFFELYEAGKEYVTEVVNVLKELSDAAVDLAKALGLSDSDAKDLLKTIYQFFNPLVKLKLAYEAVAFVLKGFRAAIREARIDAIAFVNAVKTTFTGIANAVKQFDFKAPLESLKKFNGVGMNFAVNFAGAREAAKGQIKIQEQLNDTIEKTSKLIRGTDAGIKGGSGATGLTQAEKDAAAKAAEEARKKAEADAKKAAADRLKAQEDARKKAEAEAEAEAKRSIELSKKEADGLIDVAKYELAEYIKINNDKLDDDKRMNAERLKMQQEYFDEVLKKQKEVNAAEADAKLESIQIEIDKLNAKKQLNENDKRELLILNNQALSITKEYLQKDAEAEEKNREDKREANDKFMQQTREDQKTKRAIEFQEDLATLEYERATEYEIRKTEIDARKEEDLATLEEDRANSLISLENYELAKKVIEDKYRVDARTLEEAKQTAILNEYGKMFTGLSKILGENTKAGKAAALAQVAISEGLAIANVWKEDTVLPQPFSTINRLVQTGVAIANVARAAAQINSVKAARGMAIQGPSHSNGGVPIATPNGMIEAEGGELIINKVSSRMFRNELSAINVAGGGVKFARGGEINGGASFSVLRGLQNQFTPEMMSQIISEAVRTGAFEGTNTGSRTGISDLNRNVAIRDNANF